MSKVRYRYYTQEFGDVDIHFRALRDRNQYEDSGGAAEAAGVPEASWPLFGVVWPAGEVLARLMADYDVGQRRILEVGCGIGLASLVLNRRKADITATDIHPSASRNLQFNTRLNNDRDIPFLRTGWDDLPNQRIGLFDLIIASDVLFERGHAEKLSQFIDVYGKASCEAIVVDAGRSYGGRFLRAMEALGFTSTQLDHVAPFTNPESFKGKIQLYRREQP